MDARSSFAAPPISRALFTWDPKFTKRDEKLHALEDRRVEPLPGQTEIEAFLISQSHCLQPRDFSLDVLRGFLTQANPKQFQVTSLLPNEKRKRTIFFDERRDPTSREFTARDWQKYEQYPPQGEFVCSEAFDAKELFDRLQLPRFKQPVGIITPLTRTEKRVVFINELSPSCALAIALTVPPRYVRMIRDFLSKHISNRVFFSLLLPFPVTRPSPYAFEFHLPYYALRKSPRRQNQNHTGRRTGFFKFSQSTANYSIENEWFHEAQISVILTGIDEWVWSLICIVDTSFETDDHVDRNYDRDFDAPSGRGSCSKFPLWNPREYFAMVLSRRMSQVRMEYENIVLTLQRRLSIWELDTFQECLPENAFRDDEHFQRTKRYTFTVQVLRLFANLLAKTIESWDAFAADQLFAFRPPSNDENQPTRISSHIAKLEQDVTELRFLRRTLEQLIETFESRRSNIVNHSALTESRISSNLGHAAREQATDIGLLTKVTVVYLPLSLITSVFSMTFVPDNIPWTTYLAVIGPFTLITILISFNLAKIIPMFSPH